MPRRAAHPCPWPGCGALVESPASRCPKHQAEQHRDVDAAKPYDHGQVYGTRHRQWRTMVLARHPICCDPSGCEEASVVADHIVALADGGDWSLENGAGLCVSHHNAKTAREQHGRKKR